MKSPSALVLVLFVPLFARLLNASPHFAIFRFPHKILSSGNFGPSTEMHRHEGVCHAQHDVGADHSPKREFAPDVKHQ